MRLRRWKYALVTIELFLCINVMVASADEYSLYKYGTQIGSEHWYVFRIGENRTLTPFTVDHPNTTQISNVTIDSITLTEEYSIKKLEILIESNSTSSIIFHVNVTSPFNYTGLVITPTTPFTVAAGKQSFIAFDWRNPSGNITIGLMGSLTNSSAIVWGRYRIVEIEEIWIGDAIPAAALYMLLAFYGLIIVGIVAVIYVITSKVLPTWEIRRRTR